MKTLLRGGAVAGSPEVCLRGGALHLHLAWDEDVGFRVWCRVYGLLGYRAQDLRVTCNPYNLQFYGFYLLNKGYLLLNCRLLEPQVGFIGFGVGFKVH